MERLLAFTVLVGLESALIEALFKSSVLRRSCFTGLLSFGGVFVQLCEDIPHRIARQVVRSELWAKCALLLHDFLSFQFKFLPRLLQLHLKPILNTNSLAQNPERLSIFGRKSLRLSIKPWREDKLLLPLMRINLPLSGLPVVSVEVKLAEVLADLASRRN